MVKRPSHIAALLAAFWAVFLLLEEAQAQTFNYAPPAMGSSAKAIRDDLALELTGINTEKIDFVDLDTCAEIAAIVAGETGTCGSLVLSDSPTLTTPNLGTPSALTLTNATGLPISGITGLGADVGTWLATPSSANLATAVTGESGSGALLFGTSPSITTDITIPNTGLHLLDTNASHDLIIAPGSNLTADHTLTVTTGDADRTLDISGASVTISAYIAGILDDANEATLKASINAEAGVDFQAFDADLAAIAGLTSAADKWPYFTGSGTAAVADVSSFARSYLDDANEATLKATLNIEAGVDFQAFDADLAALAGLTSAADALPYFTGEGTAAVTTLSSFSRTYLDDANEATLKATLNMEAGVDFQAFDSDLTTWAGLTPSANAQSLVTAANYAAMRGLLDIEAGTDFYSIAAADAAFQPIDADLTLLAAGTFTDPNLDQVVWWDDSQGRFEFMSIADMATEGAPAAGDYIALYGAEGDVRKVDWASLPGVGGGINNVSEDTSPTLGGDLDANAFDILFDDGTGLRDESDNEQLIFQTTASAVNQWEMTNSATGGVQRLEAAGGDAAIAVTIASKSTDPVNLEVNGNTEATLNATNFSPGANDGNALGVSGTAWADLFLASGGTIEFDGGTSNTVTCTGGNCSVEGNGLYRAGGTDVALADGGTGASLADPNADRLMFWDDSAGATDYLTLGTAYATSTTTLRSPTESFCVAASDETTDLTTGTAKVTFRMPYAFTLTNIRGSVNDAAAGTLITVDVNEGGTSVATTNKLTIDIAEETSVTAATAIGITDTTLADDAEMTIDIDGVGTTAKGLKVCLIGYQT